jgi:hypothetical protein
MYKEIIDRAIIEMVTRGHTPAAIIIDPAALKHFRRECSPQDVLFCDPKGYGSGWEYQDLPVWRAFNLTGVAVVDSYTLSLLRTGTIRKYTQRSPDAPRVLTGHDLLF